MASQAKKNKMKRSMYSSEMMKSIDKAKRCHMYNAAQRQAFKKEAR